MHWCGPLGALCIDRSSLRRCNYGGEDPEDMIIARDNSEMANTGVQSCVQLITVSVSLCLSVHVTCCICACISIDLAIHLAQPL